ncbi:MAG: thiamine pyrophosphate-requiring protein [Chloroflexi bacterium]|nr:thiamine pyrophosphate-requiring protein [Chloroflexota bacterium]
MLTEREAKPSATSAYLQTVAQRGATAHTPGAAARPARGQETRWVEVVADEVGEVLMQAWAINGVEHLFFCGGSDIMWYQESAVKLRSLGRPTPRIVLLLHEYVNLSAACGYSMVARRPTLTAAHVELGMMNYGGAIHNAYRGGYPVMLTSGKTPNSYGGTAKGDRDQWVMWVQDLADYGAIIRQYMKWDHDLRATDNPGLIVSRALQLAMTEPWGPVYMSIPRDVAMMPVQGARFPSVAQLGIPEPPVGDPDAIRQAARLLVEAEQPLAIAGQLGRDPEAVGKLVALAELLALPISEPRRERMNFPTNHPLYEGGPKLEDADLVLLLEALVPWLPGYLEPSPGAKVISIAVDPAASRNLHYEFSADLRIAGDPGKVLGQLLAEVDRLLTASRRQAIAERRDRIAATSRARRENLDRRAQGLAGRNPIAPAYVSYELGQVLGDEAILLDEAVGNSPNVQAHYQATRPGSFFRSGGTSGGWGTGAAFGAKLAAPDKLVALTSGDGFFLYGVPYGALWSAVKYHAPFLSVVYQNLAYSTGTVALARFYPEGFSVKQNDYEGGLIEPAPDLAKLAESMGAYGENVAEAGQVRPALERAVRMVQQGVPAVVSVRLPQLGTQTMERG